MLAYCADMELTHEELRIAKEAVEFIKTRRHELYKRFADASVYTPVDEPVTMFMAGSPGAGKTEFSKSLIELFEGSLPVRIDADEIRQMFPAYAGGNSHVFQGACTLGVNKLFDYVLEKKLNAVIDGTFAYAKVSENIERALKHGRSVTIYYIFQEPELAWQFTQAREQVEGRRVSLEVFAHAFIKARENVEMVKKNFGERVELDVVKRDLVKNEEELFENVVDLVKLFPKTYTQDELMKMLCLKK